MITENESNRNKNERTGNPALQKKPSVLTLLAKARIYKRKEQERDQRKAKQAQREKKGEEVKSLKVGKENSQTNNPKLPNKNELPKRTTVRMALAQIILLDKHRKEKEQEAQREKK